MAKSLEEKRAAAAEASKRWRERHPERAKQVARDASRRQREAVGIKPRKKYETEEERRRARSAATKRWAAKNQDRVRVAQKTYYDKNAEKIRAQALEWYGKNKDRTKARLRISHLKKLYGLTPEQYDALGTACEICGAGRQDSRKGFRLAVDHDHDTGKVRGLLCGNCNSGIGLFKHDRDLLMKAIAYLERT